MFKTEYILCSYCHCFCHNRSWSFAKGRQYVVFGVKSKSCLGGKDRQPSGVAGLFFCPGCHAAVIRPMARTEIQKNVWSPIFVFLDWCLLVNGPKYILNLWVVHCGRGLNLFKEGCVWYGNSARLMSSPIQGSRRSHKCNYVM